MMNTKSENSALRAQDQLTLLFIRRMELVMNQDDLKSSQWWINYWSEVLTPEQIAASYETAERNACKIDCDLLEESNEDLI